MNIQDFVPNWEETQARQSLNVHYALGMNETRRMANNVHLLRIERFTPAERHAYNLAVREWLPSVTHGFAPQEIAALASTQTLYAAYSDGRTEGIMIALETFLVNRAVTHYVAAKRDLALRNFADCRGNATVAIDAFDLSMHCSNARGYTSVFLMRGEQMYISKMLLCMNEELRLAHAQQELAQSHAASGNLEGTMFYANKATKHLDRHDVILGVVNLLLLQYYNDCFFDIAPGDTNAILELQSTHGPVPSTVLERDRNRNMVEEAMRNVVALH